MTDKPEIQIFELQARPLSIPPALEKMSPTTRIMLKDRIGSIKGETVCRAGDYLEILKTTIARQAEGFFTIDEAARVLADTSGGDATTRNAKLWRAIRAGKLDVLDIDDREPVLDLADVRDYIHWLRASDINAAGFIFPIQPQAAPVVTESASAGVEPDKAGSVDKGWVMKKAALIKKHTAQWPTINRDFQDASENDLSKAAKAPGHGEWFEAAALNWADQRGKLEKEQGPANLETVWKSTKHTIEG